MKHTLRQYQSAACDAVDASESPSIILVAPTGSGKTTMATTVIERRAVPTVWLAHRTELIQQAADRLRAHGLHVGIIKADMPADPTAPVQVASVQTLVRRAVKPPAGLIVCDEVHRCMADTYITLLRHYAGVPVLGLTATPFRLDGQGLGDWFNEIIVAARPAELVADGTLIDPRVFTKPRPSDLAGVAITAGEYNAKGAARVMMQDGIVADTVETWRKRADGMLTVGYTVNVPHSIHLAERFNRAGIVADHIDGRMSQDERADKLAAHSDGRIRVLFNCMILTEGWDLPHLECIIIARPTASLCLHLQMLGRIMRTAPGKSQAVVLDHAGNHLEHGGATQHIAYNLRGATKLEPSENLGLFRCPSCGLYVADNPCQECGHDRSKKRESIVEQPGELVEYKATESHGDRVEFWRQCESERAECGYAAGWSAYRFKDRYGVWPVTVAGDLIDAAHATSSQKYAVYRGLILKCEALGRKPGWAAHRYREIFGVWPRFSQATRDAATAASDAPERQPSSTTSYARSVRAAI